MQNSLSGRKWVGYTTLQKLSEEVPSGWNRTLVYVKMKKKAQWSKQYVYALHVPWSVATPVL